MSAAAQPAPEPAHPPVKRPSLAARALLALVQFYRLFFKAWLGASCRFEPTCSAYAQQALRGHGAVDGAYLTAARLLRCHPGCHGGCDPVPSQPPRISARLKAGLFAVLRWKLP